jgi:hypothetical protein
LKKFILADTQRGLRIWLYNAFVLAALWGYMTDPVPTRSAPAVLGQLVVVYLVIGVFWCGRSAKSQRRRMANEKTFIGRIVQRQPLWPHLSSYGLQMGSWRVALQGSEPATWMR